MADELIDLVKVPKDHVKFLYVRVRQLDEAGIPKFVPGQVRHAGAAYDKIEPITLEDSINSKTAMRLYTDRGYTTEQIRIVFEMLSTDEALNLLTDRIFLDLSKDVDLLPLLDSYSCNRDALEEIDSFFTSSSKHSLKSPPGLLDFLSDVRYPPEYVKLLLAALYLDFDPNRLPQRNESHTIFGSDGMEIDEDEAIRMCQLDAERCKEENRDRIEKLEKDWTRIMADCENITHLFEDCTRQIGTLGLEVNAYKDVQQSEMCLASKNAPRPGTSDRNFTELLSNINDINQVFSDPTLSDEVMIIDPDEPSTSESIPEVDCNTGIMKDAKGNILSDAGPNGATNINSVSTPAADVVALQQLVTPVFERTPPSVMPVLKIGDLCLANRRGGFWEVARIQDFKGPPEALEYSIIFTKGKKTLKDVRGIDVAFGETFNWIQQVGTRVVGLYKEGRKVFGLKDSAVGRYVAGIVAEIPSVRNDHRYLVFFYDGYAQYCPNVHRVAQELRRDQAIEAMDANQQVKEFFRDYLRSYPEKAMVRLQKGAIVKTELDDSWLHARVLEVDASQVKLRFDSVGFEEWIYRGSLRLHALFSQQKAAKAIKKKNKMHTSRKQNRSLLEYIRDQGNDRSGSDCAENRRQTARKSTSKPPGSSDVTYAQLDNANGLIDEPVVDVGIERVRKFYATKPKKYVEHDCSPACQGQHEDRGPAWFKYENPLAIPLRCGWVREIYLTGAKRHNIQYRTPCGKDLKSPQSLFKHLIITGSPFTMDLFCYKVATEPEKEYHIDATDAAGQPIVHASMPDMTRGKEPLAPLPVVNTIDRDLPPVTDYRPFRFVDPSTDININRNNGFMSGCECKDYCQNSVKCACQQLTYEPIEFYARVRGLKSSVKGYYYRRLRIPLVYGIYECNDLCGCDPTRCLNRVVQYPMQRRLQLFKTVDKGWGIRTLDDIPQGAFICTYSGEILSDGQSECIGMEAGDEFLADLDYIEVAGKEKDGYEADVIMPEDLLPKKPRRKESATPGGADASTDDDDVVPGDSDEDTRGSSGDSGAGNVNPEKRRKSKQSSSASDDNSSSQFPEMSKISLNHPRTNGDSVNQEAFRKHFLNSEEFSLNAKIKGNLGRYLNHSCDPNLFVQNVFVDTHDLRFPWVSFFARRLIKRGEELCWDYCYEEGKCEGKTMYCNCKAETCRGRLL